jgi:hypothetical protein
MLEVLFELFGELLLNVFGEVLVELGLRGLAQPFERKPSLWWSAISYALLGLALGGLSLLVWSGSLVPEAFRLPNLIVTPIVAGALMHALGRWREGRGQTLLRIDRFGCGWLFAFAFGLVRYFFAH